MTMGQAAVKSGALSDMQRSGALKDDLLFELVRSGEIIPLGDGQFGLAGRALKLFRRFTDTFAAMARQWGAEERIYPSLIPAPVIGRSDYFSSFPQHATFVSHLPDKGEGLADFCQAVEKGENPARAAHRLLSLPTSLLSSAVCYHCYEELAARRVPAEGITLTAQERCFRFEGGEMKALSRQWEFTMREVVFIGSASDAASWRKRVLDQTVGLARELGLTGKVESASDPFFGTDRGRGRALFQKALELKYELRVPAGGGGETLAVASFNLHQDYFGRAFNIKLPDGTAASSACVAFGVERWVYVSLLQGPGRTPVPRGV